MRRSITGPLIIIVIGVIFLLRNFRPDLLRFDAWAQYWPFLLIGAGIIGVIEVLLRARGDAPPVRPFGGAWIFWLLLFCFWMAVLGHRNTTFNFGDFNSGRVAFLGSDYNYDASAAAAAAGASRLVVENIHGDLTIRPGTDENVHVSGQKVVRAFDQTDADRANQQSPVRIDREGDELVVRAADTPFNRARVSANLEIAMPKSMNLVVRGRSGDTSIQGVDGAVMIDSGRGDVTVEDIGGAVAIESSRAGGVRASRLRGDFELSGRGGDVHVDTVSGLTTINGEYSGTLEFTALSKPFRFRSARTEFTAEAVPGTINLDLSDLRMRNVAGPVLFHSANRDIDVAQVTNGLDLSLDRGDIRVDATEGPLPKIEAHVHNGDIALALPAKGQFELDGSTGQGEVDDSFGSPLRVESSGHSASIRGRTGDGPAISITTDRGTITVRKG